MMLASSRREADAYLAVSLGNLALLTERGLISPLLAGEVATALLAADQGGDLELLRALAEECRRSMDHFQRLDRATDASPEALIGGRLLARAYLRALVGWKGRWAR